jgi:hypothetical protein
MSKQKSPERAVAFEVKGSRSVLLDHRAAEAIVQADARDVGRQVSALEQRLPWSGWRSTVPVPDTVPKLT